MGLVLQAISHHKFILVVVDYATQYPEATPLRNMQAETVAKELAQIFMKTRIPKQVVTDQGISRGTAPTDHPGTIPRPTGWSNALVEL